MAAAPAPARVPARRHYRVQLRFVTEEQLFAPGPLASPNPRSLRLEVHAAGEEADATVTDGEVLGTTHPRESRAQVAARGCACTGRVLGAAGWKDVRGRVVVSSGRVPGRGAHSRGGAGVHPDGFRCEDPVPLRPS